MLKNMPLFLASFSDMIPGIQVLDRLRCRKTVLEILSSPVEWIPVAELTECNEFEKVASGIVSSWMIWVKDIRQGRIFSTRIDCDNWGNISRFELYKTMIF
jgi:hypothetical protein